jgi:hypothetical protein
VQATPLSPAKEIGPMAKFTLLSVALALFALTLAPAVATAGERLYWSGKDPEGCRHSFSDTGGGYWTAKMTIRGKTVSGTYKEVTRCEDFIELQLDVNGDSLRERLYKDKYLSWSKTSGRWIEMAKGKWR